MFCGVVVGMFLLHSSLFFSSSYILRSMVVVVAVALGIVVMIGIFHPRHHNFFKWSREDINTSGHFQKVVANPNGCRLSMP
jgi:hypothetical protein